MYAVKSPRVSVFTPSYNRANTLHRVYESLVAQNYRDFNWIIVDDGSQDNTREVVEKFTKEADFEIKYIYKENGGKHTAINRALKETDSELFLIADSDDSFRADALEVFVSTWDSIPQDVRPQYKGVIARCYNAETGEGIGTFSKKVFDSNDLDALFKLKLRFEKWNIVRTDVMKEFAFPEPNEKLKFYPETVIWCRMARKYKTRYVDEPLRGYYRDQENSLITRADARSRETIYLWQYYINEAMDYLWKSPTYFFKSFIGFPRDCILSHINFRKAIKRIDGFGKRLLIAIFYPVGYIFALLKKRNSTH